MKDSCQPATQNEATIPQPVGRLIGSVLRPNTLTSYQHKQMYELLAGYFRNITLAEFEGDLAEKEWVIILSDAVSGQIQGFSTLIRLRLVVGDQPIVAFFSGDTIINRQYWGETVLPRLWGRHVFGLAESIHEAKVYWFLISSGYKTYRFLPVFFREFYPTYQRPTPAAVKQILDTLAQHSFPDEYDAERGLIRFDKPSPLRFGVAEITAQRLKNRHIAFFAAANPGHAKGDQLACLVELTHANLTAAGRRMLGIK
ncbi:MAG: hypothetical protein GY764_04780 [Halieaceae bacterium]|nr:hypothetical protein [Halieaceae bacterium]